MLSVVIHDMKSKHANMNMTCIVHASIKLYHNPVLLVMCEFFN